MLPDILQYYKCIIGIERIDFLRYVNLSLSITGSFLFVYISPILLHHLLNFSFSSFHKLIFSILALVIVVLNLSQFLVNSTAIPVYLSAVIIYGVAAYLILVIAAIINKTEDENIIPMVFLF